MKTIATAIAILALGATVIICSTFATQPQPSADYFQRVAQTGK